MLRILLKLIFFLFVVIMKIVLFDTETIFGEEKGKEEEEEESTLNANKRLF
jgi:hypothetical protein